MIDGKTRFECSYETYLSTVWKKTASFIGASAPLLSDIQDDRPLPAYISHGRLVVSCECGGAEYVWKDGPLLMICAACGNSLTNGKFRPVVLPDNLDVIDSILSSRPFPANRNWLPNEAIEFLALENISHDVD